MAILVTGGAGYIGSHTVVELLNANKDVSLMPVAGTLNDEKIMDSHTFISITAAIQQVHNITKELVKLDPKNKDFYLANSLYDNTRAIV